MYVLFVLFILVYTSIICKGNIICCCASQFVDSTKSFLRILKF
jgi:hypothetical protein